ncbi:LacI family DNA-binding transcriptional regulator [Paraoerskovia marina]|uniref:LacI family DNA-binding transcriptional regulator n=1 Tax=Paraoerskovia marina TaxID=545619 RepID=UPI0012F86D54|nr:LacI family DNA-binding transcriptional regulator [Paraoerskovia marina]
MARVAGVSTAVVSYAVNGRPGVSGATRDRVLRVADQLGWRPHAAAQSLRARSEVVAMLVTTRPHPPSTHLFELVVGAQQVLNRAGVELALHLEATHAEAGAAATRWWAERRFDAFVIPDVTDDDARVSALRRRHAPVVLVGGGKPSPSVAVVDAGNDGFVEAVELLHALGHRRIGYVGGSEALRSTARRIRVLRRVVESAEGEFFVATGDGDDGTATVIHRMLSADDAPTALVTDDDHGALIALDTARRLGLRVPWDLSVIAGSDSTMCQLAEPPITALPFPGAVLGAAIGAATLGLLGAAPATPDDAAPVLDARTPAPPQVILRATTAPPPRST